MVDFRKLLLEDRARRVRNGEGRWTCPTCGLTWLDGRRFCEHSFRSPEDRAIVIEPDAE